MRNKVEIYKGGIRQSPFTEELSWILEECVVTADKVLGIEIVHFVVSVKYREKGIGLEMLNNIADFARVKHARFIMCQINTGKAAELHGYLQRRGFSNLNGKSIKIL